MQTRQRFDLPDLAPGQIIDDATVWTGADFPDDRGWARALEPAMHAHSSRP